MNVLVLNCGSSSLRFQVIATDLAAIEKDGDRRLASGRVERIGSEALIEIEVQGKPRVKRAEALRDHKAALDAILPSLGTDIDAVGHRVVHGGEKLTRSVLIDESVIEGIEECIELAPLHNPANLKGIHAARARFGTKTPQAAVFDTSFHATMPETSYLYALPYWTYVRHKIRRYGFHGTSHRYVAYRYRKLTGKRREDVKLITLHLGNGCSACAIEAGRSIDTSMGLTPLEGLVMGTRSGDLDPSILEYLAHREGMSFAEIDAMLNKQSGLVGLSGITNDMRDLLEEERLHGDRRARLAIDLFCARVRKYIGAYLARLNGADALVFAGGIGENAAGVRERICANMDFCGLVLDPEKNARTVNGAEGDIARPASRVRVWVIPTNEELLIARDTVRCVEHAELP
jgi:acetate kinase